MAEVPQLFTFRVPIEFDEQTRVDIANDVIDFILRRTSRGLDKNNRKFARYSESYIESQEFRIAGKSKNQVDLELSGDMLTALQIINTTTAGFITIGYQSGEENDKAAWQRNNTRPDFPKRDFLGIADKDLNTIIQRYRGSTNQQLRQQREIRNRVAEEAARIIANTFRFNEES